MILTRSSLLRAYSTWNIDIVTASLVHWRGGKGGGILSREGRIRLFVSRALSAARDVRAIYIYSERVCRIERADGQGKNPLHQKEKSMCVFARRLCQVVTTPSLNVTTRVKPSVFCPRKTGEQKNLKICKNTHKFHEKVSNFFRNANKMSWNWRHFWDPTRA